MTITVANTSNTSTFEYWLNRTNELADAMSNYAVTTDSNTAVGNAAITGTFTANIVLTNTFNVNTSILVGNATVNSSINSSSITIGSSIVNSSAFSIGNSIVNSSSITIGSSIINSTSVSLSNSTSNISITIPTSSQISNGVFYLNANGSWSAAGGLLSQAVSTTGTSIQNIDSFSTSTYRTAEYLISVKDNVANNYYSSKLIVMHDGGNAYITEYGVIISNTSLGTFSANIISSNVCLQFTPVSSNTTVKFAKVIL